MNILWILTYVPLFTLLSTTTVRYLHRIPSDPRVAALATIMFGDIDAIFMDYHEHLFPEDVRSAPAPRSWSMVYE